jgi:uncharacterized protein YyaL (SSP411 family)
VSRYPRAGGTGLAVAEALISGPAEIAIVGDPADPRTAALHKTALLAAPPGAVLALGSPSTAAAAPVSAPAAAPAPAAVSAAAVSAAAVSAAPAETTGGVPLLAGRGLVDGAPAAYVCRDFTCLAPVTAPEALRDQLAASRP